MIEELDKTSENKPKRDDRGRLLPGNTGNPLGRPRGSFSLVAILREELQKELESKDKKDKTMVARALIQKYIKKAIKEEDVRLMIDAIDRIDGKPNQPFSGDIETRDNKLIDLLKNADKKTKQQFTEFIRRIYGERNAGGGISDKPSVDDRDGDIPKLQEGKKSKMETGKSTK